MAEFEPDSSQKFKRTFKAVAVLVEVVAVGDIEDALIGELFIAKTVCRNHSVRIERGQCFADDFNHLKWVMSNAPASIR